MFGHRDEIKFPGSRAVVGIECVTQRGVEQKSAVGAGGNARRAARLQLAGKYPGVAERDRARGDFDAWICAARAAHRIEVWRADSAKARDANRGGAATHSGSAARQQVGNRRAERSSGKARDEADVAGVQDEQAGNREAVEVTARRHQLAICLISIDKRTI